MSLPVPADKMAQALGAIATKIETETSHHPYLRLLKSGEWVYGQDDMDVEPGSQWVVDPRSIEMGFICWHEGEVLGEEMSLFFEAPILKSDLPEHPSPWKQQIGFTLVCAKGEDEGQQVTFKTTSHGGLKECGALLRKLGEQATKKPDAMTAVIELKTDNYKHKEYGRIYTPVFELVKFVSNDADALPDEAQADPAPDPAPEADEQDAAPKRPRRFKSE